MSRNNINFISTVLISMVLILSSCDRDVTNKNAVHMLDSINAKTRIEAAVIVGLLHDPPAVGPLIDALKDRNKSVRRHVAWTLGEIGDPQAVEPLIMMLKDDEEVSVRRGAAWALKIIDNPRTIEPLIVILKDDISRIQEKAAEALGKIGDPRAIEPLKEAQEDPRNIYKKDILTAIDEALKTIEMD